MFKQESYQFEKRKKKREDKLQNRQKEAFNLVSVWVKTGRNSQTKGKNNNVCIVYFEEVVVANVLYPIFFTLDVTHVERSPLNTVAPENTDPRSMGTTDNSTIGGVFKPESYKIEKDEEEKIVKFTK